MDVLEDRWAFYCDCLAKAGEERVEKILKFHAHLYRDGAVSRPWNLPVNKSVSVILLKDGQVVAKKVGLKPPQKLSFI